MPDGHAKRLACQIAAQMPDDREESLRVLDYVREILFNLGGGWGAQVRAAPTQLFSVPRGIDPAGTQATATADPICHLDKANPG